MRGVVQADGNHRAGAGDGCADAQPLGRNFPEFTVFQGRTGAFDAIRGEELAVDVLGEGGEAEVFFEAVGVLGDDGRLFVSGRTQPGEFQGHGFLRAFGTNIRTLV